LRSQQLGLVAGLGERTGPFDRQAGGFFDGSGINPAGLQRVLDAPKAPGHGRNPASREANEVELGVVNDDAYHDLDQGPFGTGAADSTAVDRALAWERCAQPDRHNALSDPEGVIGACSATQDMGNGSRTVLATTVAQASGLSPDEIDVRIGDSRLPPGPLSGGSRSTATLVPAALLVADRLKAELRRQSNRGSWFYFWQPGCGVELSVRNGRLIGRGPDATPEAPIGMRSQRALRGVRRATAPASRLWSRSWVATASCAFPARKSPHLQPLTRRTAVEALAAIVQCAPSGSDHASADRGKPRLFIVVNCERASR